MMQKWEYLAPSVGLDSNGAKVLWVNGRKLNPAPNLEEWLNSLGEAGWEMVERYIFKRPKQ